ncbi:MAG: putative patatin/cPLA2 family phospholipase, partial [Parvicellaceae bacterium]
MSGKTALVVQGGSLRSVFTSGILDSFMASDFNPFDIYIGVSGGAMCMSYYIANQYRDTFQILSSIFSDEKFISLKQIFKSEGYVNLEYLQKYSMRHHPLDLSIALTNIKNKLVEIVATNMANGEAVYLQPELRSWHKMMRASSTLPFLTKGYCMFDDLKLMDGGWSDPIPIKRAVELGADKVVVIRTMPADQKLEWSYFGWFGGFWHRDNPGLSKRFSEDHVY